MRIYNGFSVFVRLKIKTCCRRARVWPAERIPIERRYNIIGNIIGMYTDEADVVVLRWDRVIFFDEFLPSASSSSLFVRYAEVNQNRGVRARNNI